MFLKLSYYNIFKGLMLDLNSREMYMELYPTFKIEA